MARISGVIDAVDGSHGGHAHQADGGLCAIGASFSSLTPALTDPLTFTLRLFYRRKSPC